MGKIENIPSDFKKRVSRQIITLSIKWQAKNWFGNIDNIAHPAPTPLLVPIEDIMKASILSKQRRWSWMGYCTLTLFSSPLLKRDICPSTFYCLFEWFYFAASFQRSFQCPCKMNAVLSKGLRDISHQANNNPIAPWIFIQMVRRKDPCCVCVNASVVFTDHSVLLIFPTQTKNSMAFYTFYGRVI